MPRGENSSMLCVVAIHSFQGLCVTIPQFIYLFLLSSIDNWIVFRFSDLTNSAAVDIHPYFS